jgi:hypothetical protein
MAKTLVSNSTAPTHDEIAAQAYQIYLREGCVTGRDLEHWLQAEAELRSASNGSSNGNGQTQNRTRNGKNDSHIVPAPAPVTATASRDSTSRRTIKR